MTKKNKKMSVNPTFFHCTNRNYFNFDPGELAERSIAAVLKTVEVLQPPGVRIPNSPLFGVSVSVPGSVIFLMGIVTDILVFSCLVFFFGCGVLDKLGQGLKMLDFKSLILSLFVYLSCFSIFGRNQLSNNYH